MKIVKLEAENVKRIKAVSITPEGSMVVVGGNNAQGKTSVLDSIIMALGGGKEIPKKPIRDGQDEAKVVLELDNGMTVTRTFTESGSALKITAKDGAKYGSPQGILDKLIGNLSFDPLAFSRMDEKAQLATLKKLVGLDTSKIDNERAAAYATRTEENRKLDALRKQYQATVPVEAPDEPVSIAALVDQQAAAQEAHNEYNKLAQDITSRDRDQEKRRERITDHINKIAELHRQIAELEESQKNLGKYIDAEDLAIRAARKARDEYQLPDLAIITTQIKNAETINQNVAAKKQRAELKTRGEEQKKICDSLTKKIDELDAAKRTAIAAAVYPIDGLAVDEDGITYHGIPFSQSSGAEQLRVSTAMGLAMNPALKVMTIRDGSLLDADSLALLAKMAEDAGAQVWIERVGEGAECSVIIEDGMIQSA